MLKIQFIVTQVAQSLEFKGYLVLALHVDPLGPHDIEFDIPRDKSITIVVTDNQENRAAFALGQRFSAEFTSVEDHNQKVA